MHCVDSPGDDLQVSMLQPCRINRRISMLGSDDYERGVKQVSLFQPGHDFPDRLVCVDKGVIQRWAGTTAPVNITSAGSLLRNTDRLKIHPEDCGHAYLPNSGVILPVDFIQDCRNLEVIVRFDVFHAAEGSNLWSKQVVHAGAGRTVHQVV